MTPLEVLRAARAVIENPEHWTQGAYARTSHGEMTPVASINAVSWCAVGAISKVSWTAASCMYDALYIIMDEIIILGYGVGTSLIDFNDTHTHSQVLALFDQTTARLEES